ncbi:PREDICTED: uncharacterized protein LOC105149338 [Acromyrmex echinatior]|uniref:uncharacterized protein LOC105149338 n=1 Tax=Acromyrmex echinatior TaxID=103372 RepID=UPI000580E1D0|nr:PREDICTED: uncharacterized protein LOC105149338 [Acromyrmex echinatior]
MRDLYELEVRVREASGRPIIILGDFNARAPAWDPGQPNKRGKLVLDWLGLLDLQILNRISEPTCVHPRGESCDDLTLASTSATRRITSWRVGSEVESLSEHKYIMIEVSASLAGTATGRTALKAFPRWVTGKVDRDLMEAAADLLAWSGIPSDAALGARAMDRILHDISAVSMTRRGLRKRPTTYWWNEEIAELRRICNLCRRRLTRACARRGASRESLREPWEALREARRQLRRAITRSQARLWTELVSDLDRDPWGMPYRVVINKLRAGGASIVEGLPPESVTNIVGTLFPTNRPPLGRELPFVWQDDLAVTAEEVMETGLGVKPGKAPGPDGVAGFVIRDTMRCLAPTWARCFTGCLRGGTSRVVGGEPGWFS